MADADEPDDLDREIARARRKMDAGRRELMAGIRKAAALGRSSNRIARHSEWSPDYIKKIRDREPE